MNIFNPKFTITNRMTAAITQIERAQDFLAAAKRSDDWVREVGNEALIRSLEQEIEGKDQQLRKAYEFKLLEAGMFGVKRWTCDLRQIMQ